MSSLEPNIQKHIKDVSCQDQTILFDWLDRTNKVTRLYGLKIGQPIELIAEMRWATPYTVSLKGKYVLGNKLTVDQGIWEEHQDCNVRFVKASLRVLCWPRQAIGQWVTPQFVVTEYLWRDTILVRDKDDKAKRVPNPEPPMKLADGTEIEHGYLLRDLDNQIVTQVKMEQPPYQIYRNTLITNPQGDALYAVCSKEGDHGSRRLTVGGRICRFKVDGINRQWEEVVAMQQSPQDPFSLHDLNVNQVGDAVAMELGHRGSASLWKYSALTHRVEKVHQAPTIAGLGAPRLSPTG